MIGREMVQRNKDLFILLLHKHNVSVTKGTSAHILATDSDTMTLMGEVGRTLSIGTRMGWPLSLIMQ